MAGSVDLFLNINDGLNKNLDEANKSLGITDDMSTKINKTMEELNSTTSDVNSGMEEIAEETKKTSAFADKLKEGLGKVADTVKRISGYLMGGIVLFNAADVVQDTLKVNQQMKDLSYRMGEAGKSAHQLERAVTDTMRATGMSAEMSAEWIKNLRELRVATKDITGLATVGGRFAEITGASNDGTQKLIGKLYTVGKVGPRAIKDTLREVVNTQRAFGLTAGEVDGLTDSIINSTQYLRQMGKTSAEIQKFNKGVTQLAGAFASVGVSAEEATKLIDKLLDPGAIEENAFLFSKLGVSIDDAINGNVDPAQMAAGFKDLGTELKNMSGPAAAQMAKALGMSLTDLRQMADMDMNDLNKKFSDITGVSSDLGKEQEQQAEFQREFQKRVEQTKSVFMDLGFKIMPILNKAMEGLTKIIDWAVPKVQALMEGFSLKKLGGAKGIAIGAAIVAAIFAIVKFKKKFASVNTEIGDGLRDAITTGMDEAMEVGSAKSADKFRISMSAAVDSYMEDLGVRIREGSDYAATQMSANFYKKLSESKLTEASSRFARDTGEWLDKISAGARPVSLLQAKIDAMNQKIKERIDIEKESSMIRQNALKDLKDEQMATIGTLRARLNTLKAEEKLSPAREKEAIRIQKELEDNFKQAKKYRDQQRKEEENELIRRQKMFQQLSDIERTRSIEEVESRIKAANMTIEDNKEKIAGSQLSLDMLQMSQEKLVADKQALEERLRSGKLSEEEMITLGAQRREMLEVEKQNKDLIAQETIYKEKLVAQNNEITESLKGQNQELDLMKEGFNEVDTGVMYKTFGEKIKETFQGVKGNFVSGIQTGLNKVADSMKTTLMAGLEYLKPSNWRKAIAELGDGHFIKGLGKAFKLGAKSIGSSIGKAAKVFGGPLLLMLAPLIKAFAENDGFKQLMSTLKEKIMPVVNNLIDALMPVANALMDALMPVMDIMIDLMMSLLPIVFEIAKTALPPLLKVLGRVVSIIGWLGRNLLELPAHIAEAIPGGEDYASQMAKMEKNTIWKSAHDIFKGVEDVGEQLMASSGTLKDSLNGIDFNSLMNKESSDSGASGIIERTIEKTKELYPAVIKATSNGFVQTEKAREVEKETTTEAVKSTGAQQLEATNRQNDLMNKMLEKFDTLIVLTDEEKQAMEDDRRRNRYATGAAGL